MSRVIRVFSTLAVQGAMPHLVGSFKSASGHRIEVTFGPTLALRERLDRGEQADVLILTQDGLRDLAKAGIVATESCVDVALSYVGLAVRAGAPRPDIATTEALRKTLLAARIIAYSRLGASGVFFAQLIERLGIAAEVNARALVIPQGLTAERLVSGEADLAVQQISELKLVDGIEIVGAIPDDLQTPGVFSAGRAAASLQAEAADQFIRFLASTAVAPVLAASGLEPCAGGTRRAEPG